MTHHTRTAIRSVFVKGFRSIRSLDLQNIPDLVVLHGPNGSGKSNLLRAVNIAIHAAALSLNQWADQKTACLLITDKNNQLKLHKKDFCDGQIEIRLQIQVSDRIATKHLGPDTSAAYITIHLLVEYVCRDTIQYCFEKISVDFMLENRLRSWNLMNSSMEFRRVFLLHDILQVISTPSENLATLFRTFVSKTEQNEQIKERLLNKLGQVNLFGPDDDLKFPHNSGYVGPLQIPLQNLSRGEQQVLSILMQQVLGSSPIVFLEEPETHLHPSLMGPFAQVLLDSVQGAGEVPEVDQMWIATHHHHFALALEYFDVQLVDGATQVTRKPRAMAAPHFYEPGPVWEALRQLASSAKQRDVVVFRAADGAKVTAGQILDSIEKDPMQKIAKDYAKAVTEAVVLAMQQRAVKQE